jgi:hypothetical protein
MQPDEDKVDDAFGLLCFTLHRNGRAWRVIFMVPNCRRNSFFNEPNATVESIVISANSAPLAKVRRRSYGISTALPWDQISVAAFWLSPAN